MRELRRGKVRTVGSDPVVLRQVLHEQGEQADADRDPDAEFEGMGNVKPNIEYKDGGDDRAGGNGEEESSGGDSFHGQEGCAGE